ncbi:MAG: Gfo/Idh/MocA family oxidoreductase [Mangrovibacterium sp.]|nr:Gfo/Idh/MocA family oxidoreductase [Mangrovibacterium sp.]
MINLNSRRNFIKTSAGAGLYVASTGFRNIVPGDSSRPVRIGFVGVGSRGTGMLKNALMLEGVEIPVVCDIVPERVEHAQRLVQDAGQPKPKGFTGKEDYLKVAELSNLDAIFTATPWKLHTPVMVAAMKGGKYGGTEMPACDGHDEAWELVETAEKTGMHCMLMENYTYIRNVMMVLNMVRQGMFGELTHCETGYQHDVRYATIGPKGELLWRAHERYLNNTGNRYPTHAIGPVSQWIDINRGNRYEYLVSMSSRALGLKHYVTKKFGADHPNAKLNYRSGDVNCSLIQTASGITVTLYYDSLSPRPADMIYRIQGTKGIFSGTLDKLFLEDLSPKSHEWEGIEKYQEKYDHPLWKQFGDTARKTGHGGSDYLCMRDFVEAIRNRTEFPIDVYDAATWSIITALTEESATHRSRPVEFPDFTRGKWQTRKPAVISE